MNRIANSIPMGSGIKAKFNVMLTLKEYEIAQRLITTGEANKEMADRLGITEAAVKLRFKGLQRKLGAKNRTHLAMILTGHAAETDEGVRNRIAAEMEAAA